MSRKFIAVNTLLISCGRKKTGGWAKVKFQLYTPQATQDELPGTRVDMSPASAQIPLPGGPTAEARKAVEEMPEGEGQAPTHAEKLAERKAETERKKNMRKATETVQ